MAVHGDDEAEAGGFEAEAAGFAHDGFADDVLEDDLLADLLAADLLGADEPQPAQMHDGMPICGYHRGEPIPDLGRLPQEQWLAALRPLSPRTRLEAKSTVRTVAEARAAGIVVGELLCEDGAARARAAQAPPPRMPTGAAPAQGSSRQVNFRLGPDEHARLLEAARLFGMRPTTLARVLTVRGVDRALYEERRDR